MATSSEKARLCQITRANVGMTKMQDPECQIRTANERTTVTSGALSWLVPINQTLPAGAGGGGYNSSAEVVKHRRPSRLETFFTVRDTRMSNNLNTSKGHLAEESSSTESLHF